MMTTAFTANNWNKHDAQVFWSFIAPCEHVVQVYNSENELLDVLLNFTIGGIRAGESTVVIATSDHLSALSDGLSAAGLDPFYLKLKDKYLPINAEELLDRITIGRWPDEKLFRHVVAELLLAPKRHGTPIRAFGEMVAILWKQNRQDAALELERLWNKFLEDEKLTLLCAYGSDCFGTGQEGQVLNVCGHHSRIVAPPKNKPSNDIMFATVDGTGRSYQP